MTQNQSEAKVPLSEIVSKNQTPRAKQAVERAVKESIEEQNKMIDQSEPIPTPNPKYKKIDAKKLHKLADSISAHRSEALDSEFIKKFRKLKSLRNNRHMDEPEFDDAVEQLAADTYAHPAEDDYCCACGYDISVMNGNIKDSSLALLNRVEAGLPEIAVVDDPTDKESAGAVAYKIAIEEVKQLIQKEREKL